MKQRRPDGRVMTEQWVDANDRDSASLPAAKLRDSATQASARLVRRARRWTGGDLHARIARRTATIAVSLLLPGAALAPAREGVSGEGRRRRCVLVAVLVTAIMAASAPPVAAHTSKGQMFVDGDDGDAWVKGNGNQHYNCSDGYPSRAAAGHLDDSISITVDAATCWDPGAAGSSKLPAGTYEVRYNNRPSYAFDGTRYVQHHESKCRHPFNYGTESILGTLEVDSDGYGQWTGKLALAGVPYFSVPDTTASNICVINLLAPTNGESPPGMEAPYHLLPPSDANDARGCPQGEPTVSDDGPTGPEAEGGCVSDDVDGENVNNVEGGVPASSPATTAELVQAFGGSPDDIPAEAPATSSESSLASSPSGFQSGGCPAGGTCTNVQLRWIKTINIDKRDKAGVRLFYGYETRSWLVPVYQQDTLANGEGRGTDGRTYDFLSPHVELTPVVGNAVLCSLKNTIVRTGGGRPAILSSYPSAAKTPVSPSTPKTLTLSANVGGVGLTYSHEFTTAKGIITGRFDPAKSSFTGTWVFGDKCSGKTTPDGVSLDSGIAYVYEPTDPAAVGRNYTWGRKVRKIDTNGAAVACFSPFCWPF